MKNTITEAYINELKELEAQAAQIDKLIKAHKDHIKNQLKLENVTSKMVGDTKITYTEYIKTTIDSKKLKTDFPELYDSNSGYVKTTTCERLTIK